jgi:hypothetical protein
VAKTNNYIEINGKRYDARTGAVAGQTGPKKSHRSVDGIVAKSHKRPPQPAQTLMRRSVSKPPAKQRSHIKAQGQIDMLTKRVSVALAPKLSASEIDSQRLKHAHVIPKSRFISRHTASVLPVSTLSPAPVALPQIPTTAPRQAPRSTVRSKTTADLLQHAIEQATSHQQPAPRIKRAKRRSSRIMSVSTLALLSLALFGFVLHQNMPNIKLDLASSRAGFAASLPTDQPAGYSLNGLTASTGQVAMNYHSNSGDDRAYSITEKASSWDSATLRDSFVNSASNNTYQTIDTAGRTLYLYGQRDITWVNGGIWYQVHSANALSNQQLINIATSL